MKRLDLDHVVCIWWAHHAIYPVYQLEALETYCRKFVAPRPWLVGHMDVA